MEKYNSEIPRDPMKNEINYKNLSKILWLLVFILFGVLVFKLFKADDKSIKEIKCYEITDSDIKQVKCN